MFSISGFPATEAAQMKQAIKTGSWIKFETDVAQTGKVIEIFPEAVLDWGTIPAYALVENEEGFSGREIGGDRIAEVQLTNIK
jgi:hypothetical protein